MINFKSIFRNNIAYRLYLKFLKLLYHISTLVHILTNIE